MSLWSSLKGPVLENTLESRFGKVWGLRAIDWLALGALLLSARAMRQGRDPDADEHDRRKSTRWR